MTVFTDTGMDEFAALRPILRKLPDARLTDFSKDNVFDVESLAEALLAYIERRTPRPSATIDQVADDAVDQFPGQKIYQIKHVRAELRVSLGEAKTAVEEAQRRADEAHSR